MIAKYCSLWLLLGGAAGLAAGLQALEPPASRNRDAAPLALLGNDTRVWLYAQLPDGQGDRRLSIAVRPAKQSSFLFPPTWQGLPGEIQAAAVVGDDLHVFFSEGTHRRYRFARLGIGRHSAQPLPGNATPLACGGHEPSGSMFAVVEADVAREVLDRQRFEQVPADEAGPAPDSGAADAPPEIPADAVVIPDESRYAVVCYQGGGWRVVATLPEWFDNPLQTHVVVEDPQHLYLVFVRAQDQPPIWSRFDDGTWQQPAPLAAGPLNVLSVFIHQSHPVVVGCRPGNAGWTIGVTHYQSEAWSSLSTLFAEGGGDVLPATRVAAGRYQDRIAVATWAPDRGLDVGLWPMGGGLPAEAVHNVEAYGGEPAVLDWQTQSILAFSILGALLIYVFWRRQEAITLELPLPPHLVIASFWRRFTAFALDFAPAAMLTVWFWLPPVAMWLEQRTHMEIDPGRSPPLTVGMLAGWLLCCSVHILYCGVFEMMMAATPGKRLVGCRVVSEDGGRCRWQQIVLRNVLRLVELFPLFQLWPSFILMLFTRNRQRLGDLMARSVVVHRLAGPSSTASRAPADTADDARNLDH